VACRCISNAIRKVDAPARQGRCVPLRRDNPEAALFPVGQSASAPAMDDTADASKAPTTDVPAKATPISQVPTQPNYAGRTYEQYLAANPQLQPQAAAPGPQQN